MTIKFGSDPEYFAAYRVNGQLAVLPPVVLRDDFGCPSEENGRHPIFKRYGETIVHEDGAAFEMSTPPSTNWKTMWQTLHDVKEQFALDILSKYPDVCEPHLFSLPAMHYQVERWANRGDAFYMATTFGCDPDHDVFDTETCKIVDAALHEWRYAGGHIHVSGVDGLMERPLDAIKSMVLTAGLAATAYSPVPDLERERLFLYGKPGKFRIQKYGNGEMGIEYRTPSTSWTASFPLAEKIFTWATIGMTSLFGGGLLAELEAKLMEDAKHILLSVDQQGAKDMLNYMETVI